MSNSPTSDTPLIHDIRRLIEEARESVAAAVNAGLTMLYWRIGRRIRQDVLKGERAEYGEDIVSALSRQLEDDYGRGFSVKNLRHMIRFEEVFADEAIVSTLWRQLMGFASLHPSYECDYEFTLARFTHSNQRHTVGWVEREGNPSRWQDGTSIREEVLKDNNRLRQTDCARTECTDRMGEAQA